MEFLQKHLVALAFFAIVAYLLLSKSGSAAPQAMPDQLPQVYDKDLKASVNSQDPGNSAAFPDDFTQYVKVTDPGLQYANFYVSKDGTCYYNADTGDFYGNAQPPSYYQAGKYDPTNPNYDPSAQATIAAAIDPALSATPALADPYFDYNRGYDVP